MNVNNLDYFIGVALARQLKEFVGYSDFTEKQLLELKSLSISTITDISNIKALKNLESLSITCMDSMEYKQEEFIDYGKLNSLTKLKSLVIANNLHIQKLDVSNLENLEVLIIVSNNNLEEIIGLENLKKLKRVVIVGNNIRQIPNVKQYIENTKKSDINILDYKIFNNICSNLSDYKFLSEVEMAYDTNLSFAEKIGIGEIFTYSFNMINKMNDMARVVLQNIIDDNMSDEEKILTVYQYVVDHLIYDHEELRKRREFILSTSGKISTYENRYKYINSSYEAFMSGKVVCEGYVNMLNFLLNKLNIESRTVYSSVKGSEDYTPGVYNHAANAIKIDNEWYFFDSQLEDNSYNLKFFKKTEEEFRKTHDISLSVQLPKQKIKIK